MEKRYLVSSQTYDYTNTYYVKSITKRLIDDVYIGNILVVDTVENKKMKVNSKKEVTWIDVEFK